MLIFLDWADENSDTSDWDEDVTKMIEHCKRCNDLQQLRQLYQEIDDIPNEHTRKKELINLFSEKWNHLIDNT